MWGGTSLGPAPKTREKRKRRRQGEGEGKNEQNADFRLDSGPQARAKHPCQTQTNRRPVSIQKVGEGDLCVYVSFYAVFPLLSVTGDSCRRNVKADRRDTQQEYVCRERDLCFLSTIGGAPPLSQRHEGAKTKEEKPCPCVQQF